MMEWASARAGAAAREGPPAQAGHDAGRGCCERVGGLFSPMPNLLAAMNGSDFHCFRSDPVERWRGIATVLDAQPEASGRGRRPTSSAGWLRVACIPRRCWRLCAIRRQMRIRISCAPARPSLAGLSPNLLSRHESGFPSAFGSFGAHSR
jgi:hypothetical protein